MLSRGPGLAQEPSSCLAVLGTTWVSHGGGNASSSYMTVLLGVSMLTAIRYCSTVAPRGEGKTSKVPLSPLGQWGKDRAARVKCLQGWV